MSLQGAGKMEKWAEESWFILDGLLFDPSSVLTSFDAVLPVWCESEASRTRTHTLPALRTPVATCPHAVLSRDTLLTEQN
jgi:hypothetical protein